MSHFPIFLDAKDLRVLVAGGGTKAIAKIRLLLDAGAKITALTYDDDIVQNFSQKIEIFHGSFKREHISDKRLVYIADINTKERDQIILAARELNIPYNHIDNPSYSNFTTPAMVHRGSVTVAVSTDGKAPVLSRNIRQKIERILPAKLGSLVDTIHDYRDTVNSLIHTITDKLDFWNNIYSDRTLNQLLTLEASEQRQKIFKLISGARYKMKSGHVLIVGAGPGDPELLTLKAHRAISEADVIVYDNLVSQDILNLSRRDAELIYVGKKRADHKKTQDEINEIMIEEAMKGRLVIRLKGGDPMIFGRVAEEIDALKNKKISYEIIPGITSAVGIAANCSIPLTHRDHASMVTFATGQLKAGQVQSWSGIAGKGRTIAIYMGINTASDTSNNLIKDGFKPNTPVAVIENGTLEKERRIYGTLDQLGELVINHQVESPALLIVGDVVAEAKDFQIAENLVFKIAN